MNRVDEINSLQKIYKNIWLKATTREQRQYIVDRLNELEEEKQEIIKQYDFICKF